MQKARGSFVHSGPFSFLLFYMFLVFCLFFFSSSFFYLHTEAKFLLCMYDNRVDKLVYNTGSETTDEYLVTIILCYIEVTGIVLFKQMCNVYNK